MADKVIIFGKSSWPYTSQARSAYGEGAAYVDVVREPDKLKEMLKFSKGVRKVPVIVEGKKVEIGYGGSWGVWRLIGDELRTDGNELNRIDPYYSVLSWERRFSHLE